VPSVPQKKKGQPQKEQPVLHYNAPEHSIGTSDTHTVGGKAPPKRRRGRPQKKRRESSKRTDKDKKLVLATSIGYLLSKIV
jgi:hypothetical protein